MTKMEHATRFPQTVEVLNRLNTRFEMNRLAKTREGRIQLGKITAQLIREREAANRARNAAR